MEEYIGFDVSLKETAVSIRRDGQGLWRGKCSPDPAVIAQLMRKRAPFAKRVLFDTGTCRCGSNPALHSRSI